MLYMKRKTLGHTFEVAAAVAGAAVVGGVASSAMGSKAAGKAADAQKDAAAQQAQVQWDMYQQQREDQAPWRDAGNSALNSLIVRLGLDGGKGGLLDSFSQQDFEGDPGYQWRMQQGQKGIESSAAARGGLLSGAAGKAISQYNQNFASNEYNNAYNRFNQNQANIFNRLAAIAGVGQQATNQLGQAGQNYAANTGNALQYGGTARASGYANQANALSSGLGSISGGLIGYGNATGWGNGGGYSGGATSYPVNDYYSGTNGIPIQ
jgi:hypothetical protein